MCIDRFGKRKQTTYLGYGSKCDLSHRLIFLTCIPLDWLQKDTSDDVCILLAVLTVSPTKQYRGKRKPSTPATTGPVCMPENIDAIVCRAELNVSCAAI